MNEYFRRIMIAYYYFAGAIFVMSAAGIIISITQMRKVIFFIYIISHYSIFSSFYIHYRIKRNCEIQFMVMTSSMCAEEKEFMKPSEPKIWFQEM